MKQPLPPLPKPPEMPAGKAKVVCERSLAGMVCLCIVLAVGLVPDPSELARRVVADGNVNRIHELAAQALEASAPQAEPAIPLSTSAKLRDLAAKSTEESFDNPAVPAELLQLCASADSPVEVLIEMGSQRKRLPNELVHLMMEKLAGRALGMGRPNEAALIYTTLVRQEKLTNFAADAVKCWRWAAQPARALTMIDDLVALPDAHVSRELLDLRSTLAMESNQPNRAYDLAFEAFGTCPSEARGRALKHLVALAHSGDRFEKATPLLEHHLAGFSISRQNLTSAAAALSNGTAFTSQEAREEYQTLASSLAHWHEWAEPPQPEPALELYFKLALLGDEEAYARCKELYPDLLRGDDFTIVLDHLVAQGRHLNDEALLAQLLAENGKAEKAAGHFRAAIAREPQKSSLWRSLADLYVDTANAEEAEEPLKQLLTLVPQDAWAHRQLASSYVQMGRFREALPLLTKLSELTPKDAEVLESSIALADSLAQPKEAANALAKLIALPGRVAEVDEYLDLAGYYKSLGDVVESEKALRIGFKLHSNSPRMRMNLAESLSETNATEAVALLCNPSLKDNTEAVKLLAETAAAMANPQAAIDFLAQQKPACLNDLPVARFQLAIANERTGATDQAARIVEALLQDKRYERLMAWQTLAQTALGIGDSERAERFQERYVAYRGVNDSKAWNLLGDIYTLRGKTNEATAAYERSLRSLVPIKKTRSIAEVPFTNP